MIKMEPSKRNKHKPKLMMGIQSNFMHANRHYLFIDFIRKLKHKEKLYVINKLKKYGYKRVLFINSGTSEWLLSFTPKSFEHTKHTYRLLRYVDRNHYKIGVKDKYWVIRITPKNSKQIKITDEIGQIHASYDIKAELEFIMMIRRFSGWKK